MEKQHDSTKIQPHTPVEILEELQHKCAIQEQQIDELSAKLKWYEEQFRLGQQKRFGASSEKTDQEQLSVFNEAEQEADLNAPEPVIEEIEITYKKRKQKGKTDKMMEDLPVEVFEYRLSEQEQQCQACDGYLHEMSKEVRKELKIIPAQVEVVEHVRYVYACRSCEKDNITTPIITAPAPAPVLPGSFVSPSLMAYVMSRKYAEALPLYRQEQQFKNYGIDLSRQTLANWMIHGASDWLEHLYQRMHAELIQKEVLHADESTLQVLREEGRSASNKSYMWLYATGRSDVPIYLYDYQTTRASKHPRQFLKGFKGYLHTDGYAGYNDIPNVTIIGCIAHARRKFAESLKAMPDKTSTIHTAAAEGLNYCNKLFEIERALSEATPEKRYQMRLEQSKPVLEAFLGWLQTKKKQVLPKSSFGQAINYCLNQWDKLEAYLLDGRLEISNNRSLSSALENPQDWLKVA